MRFIVTGGSSRPPESWMKSALASPRASTIPRSSWRRTPIWGDTLYHLGELVPARAHYAQALALSTSQQDAALTGRVPRGVNCLAYMGLTLWRLGHPEQALTRLHAARTLAQELSHPYSLARVLCYAAWFHQFQREVRATQERAEAALALSTEQGFAQLVGVGMFWRGWALAAQGQH